MQARPDGWPLGPTAAPVTIISERLDSAAGGATLIRLATSLPEDVCRFIRRHIHTLEQLEILRLLVEDPARPWSALDLARELRANELSVRGRLVQLQGSELIVLHSASPAAYHYQPASDGLDEQVRALLHCYQERKVAVITQIFAPSNDAAQVFADAFRFKKGDD